MSNPTYSTCIFCRQDITDGAEESGFNGTGPDWADNGDFGCAENPCTNEDGRGGHRTWTEVREILRLVELGEVSAIEDTMRANLYGARLRVHNYGGSVVIIEPVGQEAIDWIRDTAPEDVTFWGRHGIVVEPRYVADVLDAWENR